MTYKPNPKTEGSGILTAIPQMGKCPMNCGDCFFQSGRSYLEPLADNLPNMPEYGEAVGRIVRVNDGNDSNYQREHVEESCRLYKRKFYNTSIPRNLATFNAPIVLTVNPGAMTDKDAHLVSAPPNLMFVRFRTNTWNTVLCDQVVDYYSRQGVPIVLTFMAYYETEIPQHEWGNYELRKRTLNEYFAIKFEAWKLVMARYERNPLVHSCGRETVTTACRHCGNCLREYYATKERMRK